MVLNVQSLLTLILKKVDPRLSLGLSIWGLLIGVGLLLLAGYLTLKRPEEMKRHPWLRRFKDSDWMQYLAGGVFFCSMAVIGILSASAELGREVSEVEGGIVRGLIIVALVAFLFGVIGKVTEKFNK
jgi:hypothetical protein